jgi:hypothetical protein
MDSVIHFEKGRRLARPFPYSPYLANSQCPGAFGEPVSNDCLNSLLDTVASHTKWVRTYGSTLGSRKHSGVAKKNGAEVGGQGRDVDGNDANTRSRTS